MPVTALIIVLYFHILSISVVSKHLLTTITSRGFPSRRQWCLTVGASPWVTRRRTSLSLLSGTKPTSSYQVKQNQQCTSTKPTPHHLTWCLPHIKLYQSPYFTWPEFTKHLRLPGAIIIYKCEFYTTLHYLYHSSLLILFENTPGADIT